MQFSKEVFSNITCVLIYSLTNCVLEDGFKTSRNMSMIEFTVKKATVFRVATILNKALCQI